MLGQPSWQSRCWSHWCLRAQAPLGTAARPVLLLGLLSARRKGEFLPASQHIPHSFVLSCIFRALEQFFPFPLLCLMCDVTGFGWILSPSILKFRHINLWNNIKLKAIKGGCCPGTQFSAMRSILAKNIYIFFTNSAF